MNARFEFRQAGALAVLCLAAFAATSASAQVRGVTDTEIIIGTITATGEALVVNDTANSPTYYQNPLLPDTRAEAALPLRVGERVLGLPR